MSERFKLDVRNINSLFLPDDVSNRIIQTDVVGGGTMTGKHLVAISDTTAQLGRRTPNDLCEVAEGEVAEIEIV